MTFSKYLLLSGLFLLVTGCTKENTENNTANLAHWYTDEQVYDGAILYIKHCAVCHGDEAQGLTQDWIKKDATGNFPAPPLNGTAHAWHHPLAILDRVIAEGGIPLGGTMPSFSAQLNEEERLHVISYFQSFWDEDVYEKWEMINNQQN